MRDQDPLLPTDASQDPLLPTGSTRKPLRSKDATQYRYDPSKVRESTRHAIRNKWPELAQKTRQAAAAWRLLDVLMFPPFPDKGSKTHDKGSKTHDSVITCYMMATLERVKYDKSYQSGERLSALLNWMGLKHDINSWDWRTGIARSVHVDWEDDIQRIITAEREYAGKEEYAGKQVEAGKKLPRVYFDTGDLVGKRSLSKEAKRLEAQAQEQFLRCSLDHPARKTIELLNGQNKTVQNKIWNQNQSMTVSAIQAMPEGVEKEKVRKEYAQNLLLRLPENKKLYYKTVDGTSRVYVVGSSIVQLPREIRKVAFHGCHEIDLSSAQIAIASVLLPKILGSDLSVRHTKTLAEIAEKLANEQSYWTLLLKDLGIPDQFKPELKVAGCSTLFGKRLKNVVRDFQVDLGSRGTESQGTESQGTEGGELWETGNSYMSEEEAVAASKAYANHRWVKAFDAACARYMKKIDSECGAENAFGEWEYVIVPKAGDRRPGADRGHRIRSCMAAVMQSYEQKIMQAAIEEIAEINAKRTEITVVAWLHDGLTIKANQRQDKYAERIAESLTKRASEMGFPTRGEITKL